MLFFTWGRQVVPLGVHDNPCEECGDKVQLLFAYRVFGLFWLGFSWQKQHLGQCIACGATWKFDGPAEATNSLVSWNYRYGWLVWVGLIVLGVTFSNL